MNKEIGFYAQKKNTSRYLDALIDELTKLPGIGRKSASRLAFYILSMTDTDAGKLTGSITELKKYISICGTCGGISDSDTCSICRDETRDRGLICIVESARDILTIEQTGRFPGIYHVLMGVISPLDGIGPEELNITSLLDRCSRDEVRELILALNSTVEGDATSLYLARLIKDMNIRVTRIAHGLPVGADLEYTDSATIIRSIEGRVAI